MSKIYMFSVIFVLVINFKINYSRGASLNYSNVVFFENQLQRTIRQTNVEECSLPTIPNGNIIILKQKITKKRHFLSINITCDPNYVLQPPNDFIMSCFNGFWDVDETPQCKRCVKRNEDADEDDNTDSQLFCPESLNDIFFFTDCGQRIDATHQPFVVNGTLSKFAEFPWHVGLYKKDQNDQYPVYICGGSIINERSILTVAHCLSDGYGKMMTSREYYAAAGKFHRNYYSDRDTTQNRKIVRIDLHPQYRGELRNYAWDIAVIVVNEPFEISVVVHPVCIDWKTQFENEHLAPEKYGEVAGWGKTETDFNLAASELRVLKVPFIDIEQCNKLVPNSFIRYITHDKFCAGYMNGSSVCDGDSGGGLVFQRQHKGKTKFYIRGLVSVGLQDNGMCDSYKYSTYTKVSDYTAFIRESLQNMNVPTLPPSISTTDNPISLDNSTETSEYCITPNDEKAKCISIYECDVFLLAYLSTPTRDVVKFMKDSVCGKESERKVCCGSTFNYVSVIHSNPVTTKPIEHSNLNLLPTPGVCGRQTRVRKPKIYGGTITDILDYPWMALLEFGTPEKSAGFLCAGSLINERYVMTAAHCAVKTRSADLGQVFRVRLGEYNTDTEIDCVNLKQGTGLLPNERNCADPPLNVDVEEIIVHPEYNSSNYVNDIALLRLASTISYTDFIKPICLPLHGERSLPGKQLSVAGWGQIETDRYSPIKRKTFLYAIPKEDCVNKFEKIVKIVDSHICVINHKGSGECTGDTGGPLMSTLTNSKDIYAEGIMSFGTNKCGTIFPSVATNVTASMDWILNVIKP